MEYPKLLDDFEALVTKLLAELPQLTATRGGYVDPNEDGIASKNVRLDCGDLHADFICFRHTTPWPRLNIVLLDDQKFVSPTYQGETIDVEIYSGEMLAWFLTVYFRRIAGVLRPIEL